MKRKLWERLLSLTVAVVMTINLIPVQVFAAETDSHAGHEHTEQVETVVTDTEPASSDSVDNTSSEETQTESSSEETEGDYSEEYYQLVNAMDDILVRYLGATDISQEDVEASVKDMDWDTIQTARYEIYELAESGTLEKISDEEISIIEENYKTFEYFSSTLNKYSGGVSLFASDSFTMLDGQLGVAYSGSSDADTGTKESETAATFQAWASGFWQGSTNTITITNNSGKNVILTFDYSISGDCSACSLGKTSGNGTYTSSELTDTSTVTITLTGKGGFSGGDEPQLYITNVTITEVVPDPVVTFDFDAQCGSVAVDGVSVSAGETKEVTTGTSITLAATAASGYTFYGWTDSTGKLLSNEASYTITPNVNTTVKAVFGKDGDTGVYSVGGATQQSKSSGLLGATKLYYYTVSGTYLFDDFTSAMTAAANGTSKYVVLMNNATLTAGTYTIPAGVTFLVPFDSANTLYTTDSINTGTYSTPTAYRTLTLADGANIVVNGAMSLSAQHKYAAGSKPDGGAPTGPVSFVKMQGSSNITINNGGALYAYGFVTGSGTVTANSGATVYELFQITDFRGGTQSTDMENGVFPLSQYYVQNIEVPMTIYAGAKEYSYTTIYMSSTDFSSSVAFIGSSGSMFELSSGYVVKRYDGTTDRLVVDSYGEMTISPIDMQVGTTSINSSDYDLGINSNITVTAHSGSIKLSQDIALLPGAEIYVKKGASCTLGSGNNMYVYDADQWSGYAGPGNYKFIPVMYAPGKTYTRTDADLKDAVISLGEGGIVDASAGYVYTTSGGAAITGAEGAQAVITPGTETVTYQLVQGTGYTEIPITSAKLKNADGTYVDTTTAGTYVYVNDMWHIPDCKGVYTGTITTAETCEADGVKTYTCGCEGVADSYTEVIDEYDGHDITVSIEAVEATCTTDGHTREAACIRDNGCTYTETSTVIPATGHNMQGSVSTEASCTEAGTMVYKCANDGCTESYTEEIPATGHTAGEPVQENVVSATCTEEGSYENVTYCTVCNHEIDRVDVAVDALGHTVVTDAATAPGCETTGLTEGSHCSVCKETLVAQETVPATGHTPTEIPAVAPTCTEKGSTAGEKCSVCGKVTVATKEVAATGHTAGTAQEENHKDATCTADGSYDTVIRCTVCDEIISSVSNTIPATGHTAGDAYVDNKTEAGCTTDGSYETVVDCSVCGEELSRTETTIPATGHSYGEAVVERVESTCTVKGTETSTQECANCGDKKVETTELPLAEHTNTYVAKVEASCTESGRNAGSQCSVCGKVLSGMEEIPATGHTEATIEAVAPTCTETGLTEGKKCTVCGVTTVAQTVVEATGHTEATIEAVAPTCTETGLTEGKKCTVCGVTTVAQTVVEATGHTEETIEAAAPTCTETGLTEGKKCTVCGMTTVAQTVVEATGHTEATIEAVAPTCTATGLTEGKKCTVCGVTTVAQTTVAALGHTTVVDAAVAPGCETTGLTAGSHCSTCGTVFVAQTEVAATNHEYISAVTTKPTCTTAGVKTYTCLNDDTHTYTEEIAATGHTEVVDKAVAPTCTETGLTEGSHCDICGETIVAQTIVETLGHTEIVDEAVAPNCTETGLTEGSHCDVCGETIVAQTKVDALGHTEIVDEAVAPGCETTGLTEGKHCDVCGETIVAQTKVDALGHTEIIDEAVAPNCTETGLTEGKHCDVCGEVLVAQTKVDALGHTEIVDEAVAPTCTEAGLTEGKHCDVCGEVLVAQTTVEKLGHTEVVDEAAAPTCTATGLTEGSHCDVCGEVLVAQTKVDALGHTEIIDEGKEATCTETGLTDGSHCDVCGEVIVAQEEISVADHTKNIEAATCTEDQTCTVCGEVLAEATGHTPDMEAPTCVKDVTCTSCGIVLVESTGTEHLWASVGGSSATCTQSGVAASAICFHCSAKETGQIIAPLGHSWDDGVVVNAATCSAEGQRKYTCTRLNCDGNENGNPAVEYRTIEKLPHTEVVDKAVAPTCTETGLTEGKHCSVCKEVLAAQETVAATGHTEVVDEAVGPTCTETGLTAGKHCDVCGEVLVAQETIEKTDHSHEGKITTAPTCTEEGVKTFTCTACGDSYTETVAATGHTEEEIPAVDPTCTETGLKAGVKCSVCDDILTEQEEIPVVPHPYNEGEITTAPTCTSEGEKTFTCTVCGDTYTEKIEKAKHTEETVPAVKATCSATGLTEGTKCSVCGEVLVAQETVEKLPHTEVADAAVEATCTKSGLTEGKHCSVCGEVLVAQETVEATGHTEVIDAAVAATCTKSGLTEGKHCEVCGETLVEQTVVAKLGHNIVTDAAVAATCTETGLTEGSHCDRCDYVELAQVVLPALGHTEVVDKATAPTCTETGLTEGKHCSVCNETLVAQEVVDATGHTEVVDEATAPTCTETGLTEGKHCSVCNEVLVAQEVVDATGHTEVVDEAVAPTCTETGLTAGSHCSVCNEVFTAQETVSATGHTEAVDEAVAPTCTETGLTAGSHCSVCNEVLAAQETVSATGHTEVIDEAVAPTCTETGLTLGAHCEVCGEVLLAQETVDATGHTEAVDEAVAPTCTETGLTAGSHCSVCGEVLVAQETVDATGHTEETIPETAATCTSTGLTAGIKCSVCGETLQEQTVVPSLKHNPIVDEAVPATCTQPGLTAGSHCSICGNVIEAQKNVPAAGHKTAEDSYKAPTCTETGLTAGSHCSVCGEVLVAQEEIPATGHTEITDNAVAEDCENTGLTEGVHCSVCGEVLVAQEEIPATGHTEVVDSAVEAGCTTTGLTEGVHCDVCGKTLVAQTKVPARGHAEVVDEAVAPTCTETGLTAGSHCTACGKVTTAQRTVAATGHTEVVDKATEPTCTETGLTAGKHCSVCDEITVAQEEIPALGHTEKNISAKDATCTETGLTAGVKCSVCDEILTAQEEIPALGHDWGTGRVTTDPTCEETGIRLFTCLVCRETKEEEEPALGHELETIPAQKPTYTAAGWEEYERCTREECFHSTKVEIPALGEPSIETFEEFIENLSILENMADTYVKKVSPGKDPAMLVIKYIRTGVDRYNSGSWNIMAGYEDADFAKYVTEMEAAYNESIEDTSKMMKVTGLKDLKTFYLPNGDFADIGHVFGTMDISYTNNTSINHADVAGWAGDTVDLLSAADQFGVTATEIEAMVEEIRSNYFLKYEEEYPEKPIEGTFSQTDIEGDLDGFYVIRTLNSTEYKNGTLTKIFSDYMTSDLTGEQRAAYFIANRLDGVTLRTDLREAVYNEYVANSVVSTLEGTREFNATNLNDMRKAVCYVFADYLCKLAGDYIEITDNQYIDVFQTSTTVLAPGITQKINKANTADGKQMDFYLAIGDITRSDVNVYANYNNNDPSQGWAMQRVIDQANAAQNRYGNPESPEYIENYNVIASINGDGYNMSTGEPGGLLVMLGKEWHSCDGNGFFGILSDGTAVIGTKAEYEALKAEGKVQEAIGAFGTSLVKDGKINITASGDYYTDRASRTAIGITATGKVVFLVVDGRQGDLSCGASAIELAQIMLDAGCVNAVNLDGGGSSTYVARPAGEDELKVVSFPSDGISRSVSTSLLMVSTAPSSTAFDHAVVESDYSYLTVGSTAQLSAKAVSATGNSVDMPEGVTWAVAEELMAQITAEGVLTAKANGEVTVNLMLDGQVVGSKTLYIVVPDNVYFTKESINAIYGHPTTLPVKAVYEGKEVSINENDAILTLGNAAAGTIEGFVFVGDEASNLKKVTVSAALTANPEVTASMNISLFSEDEASFDFDNADGGDPQLAWNREVTNSTYSGNNVYVAVDPEQDMVTSYTFAIDMSKIDIPAQLADLTYMLPGADMENASAWNFLLQLAERVSVLTTVEPILVFDKNMDVDFSDLTISNEYFVLNEANPYTFDEETNSLTLHLTWVDQDKPIDPDTANPLCILSGIKLTPKADAAWNASDALNVVHTGDIRYDIYLRANALYTFSQKAENQVTFGLYPFVNPDNDSEKGGHFASTYKTFRDEYTLSKAIKDGWVIEGGGFAYYQDGEKFTGICQVPDDGLYYSFDANGINIGQTPYTGDMTDSEGNEYYIKKGVKQTGWFINTMTDVRYYNPETCIREQLTATEVKSTCIKDGHCDYVSESGATIHVPYDDAGGHEYEYIDGQNICSVCGTVRVEMSDAEVKLAYTKMTYTGTERKPAVTAYAPDGRLLIRTGENKEYYVRYSNNIEVGVATVKLTAYKVGMYGNINTWRGNCAGSTTATFIICPDKPLDVVVYNYGDTAKLQWTEAMSADSYGIFRREKGASVWDEIAVVSHTDDESTVATYTVTDIDTTKEYQYRVVSRKTVDGVLYESIGKPTAKEIVPDKLDTPVVKITNSIYTGKLRLTWDAVEGAEKYEVYISAEKDGEYTKLFTTTGTAMQHVSLSAGQTRYYKVRAICSLEAANSDFTEVITGHSKLARPEIKGTNDAVTGKPIISWESVVKADSYDVYVATSKTGTYKKLASVTDTQYVYSAAKAEQKYYFKVVAVYKADSVMNSVYSAATLRSCDLPMPESITVTQSATGKNIITWSSVNGAEKYDLYIATAPDGEFEHRIRTSGTRIVHNSMEEGVIYLYKVRAVSEDNTGAHSAGIVTNSKLLTPVVKITNSIYTGKLRLTWDAVEGAEKYEVYISAEKDGEYTKLFTTTGTAMQHVSLSAGQTRYYKVRAISSIEGADSDFTEVITGHSKLARPEIKGTNDAVTGKPIIRWESVVKADSYDVYVATSKTGTYKKLASVTDTQYVYSAAKAEQKYYFKVMAVYKADSAMNSAYSAATLRSCDLPMPESITITQQTATKHVITWSSVNGAEKYDLYVYASPDAKIEHKVRLSGTTIQHITLEPDTVYCYKVRAVSEDNTGAHSAFTEPCVSD